MEISPSVISGRLSRLFDPDRVRLARMPEIAWRPHLTEGLGDHPDELLRQGLWGYLGRLAGSLRPDRRTGLCDRRQEIESGTRHRHAHQQRRCQRLARRFVAPYRVHYLSSQVKDYELPDDVNKLTPVVDLSWSSVAG
jgi:hypothetical protein